MPVPSLPLEVVGLIVEQVRLSCENDDSARRLNGLSIALVCRAWRDFGTGVVWYRLVLDSPEKACQEHETLSAVPHLAALVKEIDISKAKALTVGARARAATASAVHVDSLLLAFPTLQCVKLSADWVGTAVVLSALRHVPSLRVLFLDVTFPRLQAAPLTHQLQHLSSLVHLHVAGDFADEETSAFPSPPTLLPLQDLTIRCASSPNPASVQSFAMHLVKSIDPSTLRILQIALLPPDEQILSEVARFPHLTVLVATFAGNAPRLYDQLLAMASFLPRLKVLCIAYCGIRQNLYSPSTPTLSSFLDSLPTIYLLSLPGFYFNPGNNETELDPCRSAEYTVLRAVELRATAVAGDEAMVTYAKVQYRDGDVQWCQCGVGL
ncbi:hypothetical protein JCM8097_006625 [Rhodosporidiobolus ruineniae]